MGIYEKLLKIQTELNVPKGQYNDFGNFHYRSCEDIQNAVKPFLQELKCILRTGDEIVMIGSRYYVKATATLIDCENGEKVENTAYAREDESKPKMDGAQITGSSSSYARKYALNGLFCLDDVKDADASNINKSQGTQNGQQNAPERPEGNNRNNTGKRWGNNGKSPQKGQKQLQLSQQCYESIIEELKRTGIATKAIIEQYKVGNLRELSEQQYREVMEQLKAMPDRQKDRGRTFKEVVGANYPPDRTEEGLPWYSERG